jgi:hypothetical protein
MPAARRTTRAQRARARARTASNVRRDMGATLRPRGARVGDPRSFHRSLRTTSMYSSRSGATTIRPASADT